MASGDLEAKNNNKFESFYSRVATCDRVVTLSNIMKNSQQKLRKANKELKDEVAELKVKLEKVLRELSK